jgi:hypothetical protein
MRSLFFRRTLSDNASKPSAQRSKQIDFELNQPRVYHANPCSCLSLRALIITRLSPCVQHGIICAFGNQELGQRQVAVLVAVVQRGVALMLCKSLHDAVQAKALRVVQ